MERVDGKAVRVGLHFVGWHKKFDEVYELPRDSEKLAPHRTFSSHNPTAKRIARGQAAVPSKQKKRKRSSGGASKKVQSVTQGTRRRPAK